MPLADTLLRLAEPPALFEARWSDEILEEMTRTLELRFGKSAEKARNRESVMREFFPNAMVHNHRRLIDNMPNHPKDRHVLAAAVASRAAYLVTFNLKDFSIPARTNLRTQMIDPSSFLALIYEKNRSEVRARLKAQAAAIGVSTDDLYGRLAQSVPGFVELLR
jgi:predicted nucleic acid-binding protein